MIRLSEPIFRSIQGEGPYTGALSVWVRFFGCNLNCNGFMQENPTDPKTFILPQFSSLPEVDDVMQLPVFERGCDSGYSWHHFFKKLTTNFKNEDDLISELQKFTYDGSWRHPITNNFIDLCFTGGEPMLQQDTIVRIVSKLAGQSSVESIIEGAAPVRVQIETNGTKALKDIFKSGFDNENSPVVAFNISPKLFNVSGEKSALKLDVVSEYYDFTPEGCLKFVVNNRDETWRELDSFVLKLRDNYIEYPIFIMPVGATKEQQEDSKVISEIADRAIENGYHVSSRVHCTIWGNTLGS